jgi:hypothetical protein
VDPTAWIQIPDPVFIIASPCAGHLNSLGLCFFRIEVCICSVWLMITLPIFSYF